MGVLIALTWLTVRADIDEGIAEIKTKPEKENGSNAADHKPKEDDNLFHSEIQHKDGMMWRIHVSFCWDTP